MASSCTASGVCTCKFAFCVVVCASADIDGYCFLKWSKTYLQHLRTCFIAESFTLSAERARASHSTGEFVSRRSHYRDIRYQTERFIPDIEACIEIAVDGQSACLTDEYSITQVQVCIHPSTG